MPPLRRLLSSLRPVSRTYSSNHHHPVPLTTQYVKVKRPWFRKFFTGLLVSGTAVHLWSSSAVVQEDSASNDVKSRKGVPEEPPTSEESKPGHIEAIFFPLGWTQLRDGELYTESHPEWKTFVTILNDRRRLEAQKDELASIVLTEASKSSLLSHMLGPPFTISKTWLRHHFPSRAPPRYYESGLAITSAGISWVQLPMSNDALHRSVRPYHVFCAAKDAYSVLWGRLLDMVNVGRPENEQALGFSKSSSKTLLPSDLTTLDKLGDTSPSESQSFPSNTPRDGASRDGENARPHPSIILSTLHWLPLPKFGPGTYLYAASLAFKQRINEGHMHDLRAGRRGTFSIRGPVCIEGSLGHCVIEVDGRYDPSQSEWVSVSMHLKESQLFEPKPLGGR